MTRSACFYVVAVQVALFLTLVGISRLNGSTLMTRETGEALFVLFGISFVILAPFGLLCLFLSVGFLYMSRSISFGEELRKRSRDGMPEMFFVWRELRQMAKQLDEGRSAVASAQNAKTERTERRLP